MFDKEQVQNKYIFNSIIILNLSLYVLLKKSNNFFIASISSCKHNIWCSKLIHTTNFICFIVFILKNQEKNLLCKFIVFNENLNTFKFNQNIML